MLSQTFRRNIRRIIPFGVMWLIFSTVYTLLERGLLGPLDYYPSTGNPYSFSSNILLTPLFALLTGLMIGTIEVRYLNRFFQRRSLWEKIVYKTCVYLALIIAFLAATSIISNAYELDISLGDERLWHNVGSFMMDYSFFSVAVYIASIIVVSLFYTEVSDNIGQTVLANFFTGRYHTPREEERVFMFLDMKSSTTIAEQLGHVRYFEMLKDYYEDLSAAIIEHSAEIYQYVGDEIVVSWRVKDKQPDERCLRCFFAMKHAVRAQAEKYTGRFGLVPEFKAGIHIGKVTTGEIGTIKKDIIFTGDVLNTTARIQSLCNSRGVDLLISGDLVKSIGVGSSFRFKSFGDTELRGRGERIELFTTATELRS